MGFLGGLEKNFLIGIIVLYYCNLIIEVMFYVFIRMLLVIDNIGFNWKVRW